MKLYKLPLNIALFLSVLIILAISTYSISALSKFYSYKKVVSQNMELTLDHFHFLLRDELKTEWLQLTAPEALSDRETPLRTFHITVKREDLDSLNENLPESGKDHYIDAYMSASDDNTTRKISLRYRGDNNCHWLYEQKSLRIKLNKNDIYNMEKVFNLINPPHWYSFRDVATYKLAKKFGLMTPEYFPVRVKLNGKYMGVYMYLSQVDESLLRKHKIMPGSIYSGDWAPPNKDGISDLWFNEKYWDKKASRNAEQKNNREDITLFIDAMSNYNEEDFLNFFNKMCDTKKFLTFIALDRVFGGNHHDYLHNIKIYFDPYKGKFEPIMWDPRNWSQSKTKDLSLNPLVLRIKKNAILDNKVDKIVYSIINNPDTIKSIENNYTSVIKEAWRDIESDIYRDSAEIYPELFRTFYSTTFNMNDFSQWQKGDIWVLTQRRKHLNQILESSSVQYATKGKTDNTIEIELYISGNTAVLADFSIIKADRITVDGGEVSDHFIFYPGRVILKNKQIENPIYQYGKDLVGSSVKKYFIQLDGCEKFDISDISFTNYITGKSMAIKESAHVNDPELDIAYFRKPVQPEHQTKILKGIIDVNESLVFDEYTTVKIEPDTTFIMDSNRSIYFYGKVIAIGTKEKPIRFIAKNSNQPWGLVAVQGKATTGSKFEYVKFENGSIDTRNLIHYTSPFNIHDMDWFEVRHCKIGRNFVGDDAMHIAYAKGIVDSCEFTDARSDGLDIDISDVNITNNIFYKSGNDGLDIMTTTMNASNNVFIDMGDKGISVGEWSEANITDSFFLRTVIGTEMKDKSKVKADNLIYVDTKEKAINLYNKNKRYDTGGFLEAGNIYLLGNTKVKTDKRSAQKIENRVENILPDLKQYGWYKNLQNTPYKKFVDEAEIKYAK